MFGPTYHPAACTAVLRHSGLCKWQVGALVAMHLWRPFTKPTAVLKLVGGSTQSGLRLCETDVAMVPLMAAITATYRLMDGFSAVIALWPLTEEKDIKNLFSRMCLVD
jgi:hypothetical protein